MPARTRSTWSRHKSGPWHPAAHELAVAVVVELEYCRRGHRGRWERRVGSCIKERGAVYVLCCKEDRGQRVRRVRYCVRNSTVSA